MGLKSMDSLSIKQEESIKHTLKIVEKRVLKEYPHTKTVIEELKGEILAKYPTLAQRSYKKVIECQPNDNKLLIKISTLDYKSIYMDVGSSSKALCAIILVIVIGLFLSRKPLKKMIDILKSKGMHYPGREFISYTPNLKLYYQRGFFTLYWTIVWLVCRFTFIKPIFLVLNETIDSIIFARFLAIISLSMGIALIPSLVLTSISDLNETGKYFTF